MAGSKSNALETDILTWAYTATAVTRPNAWNLALYTDAAGLGSDQPSTEATVGNCPGYARQAITSWTVSGNQVQNAAAASFTASGGAWATVRYFAIIDQTGRMLHWGDIPSASQNLLDTQKIDFAINSLTFNED